MFETTTKSLVLYGFVVQILLEALFVPAETTCPVTKTPRQATHKKTTTWNAKQQVVYGCFTWMIPNHYIKKWLFHQTSI